MNSHRTAWAWVLATAALALAAGLAIVLGWDALPDPLPQHFNGRGEPDAWMAKTYRNAVGMAVLVPAILTVVSAGALALTQQAAQSAEDSYPKPDPVDLERTRTQTALLLPVIARWMFALAALYTSAIMAGLFGIGSAPFSMPALLFAIVALCGWLLWDIKSINDRLDADYPTAQMTGKMKWGMLYYDPAEPHAMVSHPNGSSSLNFAQKKAWWLLAALLAPTAFILVLVIVAA